MKRNSQNTGNIILDICDNLENCAGTPDTRHKLESTDFNVVRVTCETEDGIYGDWGTGTVIGPNKILTAAHVANIGRYHQKPLIVYAGEHGVGSVPKKYTVSSIKIHPSYRFSPGHPKHDLAVLTTNETFTQYKPFSRAPKPLDNTRLIWTGYPSDLVQRDQVFSQWETQFSLSRDNGTPFNLRICAVSARGQSGSGLINSDNGDIIGILIGGCTEADIQGTVFTLLRDENYDFVSDEVFGRNTFESKIYKNNHQHCSCHQHHNKSGSVAKFLNR